MQEMWELGELPGLPWEDQLELQEMAQEIQEEMQELSGQPPTGLPKEQLQELQRLDELREFPRELIEELQGLLEAPPWERPQHPAEGPAE